METLKKSHTYVLATGQTGLAETRLGLRAKTYLGALLRWLAQVRARCARNVVGLSGPKSLP